MGQKNLTELFCGIKCEADSDLTESVCRAIELCDKRARRLKFWTFSAVGFISLIGLVPAYLALSSDFAQSGFFDYFSLLSVKFWFDGTIFSYWKELFLSLLESLPVVSIVLSLSLIFIFFLSLKYAVRQIIRNQLSLIN